MLQRLWLSDLPRRGGGGATEATKATAEAVTAEAADAAGAAVPGTPVPGAPASGADGGGGAAVERPGAEGA
jgi:hypothetical protein